MKCAEEEKSSMRGSAAERNRSWPDLSLSHVGDLWSVRNSRYPETSGQHQGTVIPTHTTSWSVDEFYPLDDIRKRGKAVVTCLSVRQSAYHSQVLCRNCLYDMIRNKSLTSTEKLSDRDRKETKTNKRKCPLSSAQVQDPWRQSVRNKNDYGGKDLWKRWVLHLEWKTEGVMDGESTVGDCDEVICAGWGEPGGQWTEWGWRNDEGSWFHR